MQMIERIRWTGPVLAAALMLAPTGLSAQDSSFRLWTSRDRSETVVARMTGYDPDQRQVTLEDQAGHRRTVELKQLSATDQRFVRRAAPEQRQEPAGDAVMPAPSGQTSVAKRDNSPPRKGRRTNRDTTHNLYGIDWQTDFDSGFADRGGRTADEQRPVMWFRVLGDLDGFM